MIPTHRRLKVYTVTECLRRSSKMREISKMEDGKRMLLLGQPGITCRWPDFNFYVLRSSSKLDGP